MTAALCKAKGDDVVYRFFCNVVPLQSEIFVSELDSLEHLGDLYEANKSWVIHESLDNKDMATPALAK
eukprot:777108-Pleurochrysis_carterae.AAC.1